MQTCPGGREIAIFHEGDLEGKMGPQTRPIPSPTCDLGDDHSTRRLILGPVRAMLVLTLIDPCRSLYNLGITMRSGVLPMRAA